MSNNNDFQDGDLCIAGKRMESEEFQNTLTLVLDLFDKNNIHFEMGVNVMLKLVILTINEMENPERILENIIKLLRHDFNVMRKNHD